MPVAPAAGNASQPRYGLQRGDALVLVDVQNDFLPGGALGIAGADAILQPLTRSLAAFQRRGLAVFATRDWHPADHCSFRARGGPWPPHCIAGTTGAQFSPGLQLPQDVHIISKAVSPEADAYSGFQDTDLLAQLRRERCSRVFLAGLATDYCVRATGLDALAAGLAVIVLTDAVRAVDVEPGDGVRALEELTAHGALLATSGQLC